MCGMLQHPNLWIIKQKYDEKEKAWNLIYFPLPVTSAAMSPSALITFTCTMPTSFKLENDFITDCRRKVNTVISFLKCCRYLIWVAFRVLLTYRLSISLRSCGSSSGVTDRSAIETAADAVSVTSSTTKPRDSSSGSSRWWVCSLARVERSNWQLNQNQSKTSTDILSKNASPNLC